MARTFRAVVTAFALVLTVGSASAGELPGSPLPWIPIYFVDGNPCNIATSIHIGRGNSIIGPSDFAVVGGKSALHLDVGAVLNGPLKITICDGRISLDPE